MLSKALFSSASGSWTTPPELYAELDHEFHFDFDPCPSNPTRQCPKCKGRRTIAAMLVPTYESSLMGNEPPCDNCNGTGKEKFDGLSIAWGKSNYVNPPYGREIGKWLAKGVMEWKKGKTVVFLIPSRTDTKWWHDYVMKADEIRFIKGRLKFSSHENSAPFPSAIVIFERRGR